MSQLGMFAAGVRSRLGESYKSRFVQIFLGLKFWEGSIPSARSNNFIASGTLETLLDDLYAKSSRPITEQVAIFFEGNHLPRTGVVAPGHKFAQNTWRNNFQLQKGVGCYAPSPEFDTTPFLDQPRLLCPHLLPAAPGVLAGGTCELAARRPSYRGEEHRKWLRIDPGGGGLASADLLYVNNFAPWVSPGGIRVPVLPLVTAIYHDADPGLSTGSRRGLLTLDDFAADFRMSPAELVTYFDDDPANPYNAAMIAAGVGAGYTPFALGSVTAAPLPPAPRPGRRTTRARPLPIARLMGTSVAAPVVNPWWDAEQAVANHLERERWEVHIVSRQQLGYDIIAKKGAQTLLIEVKSSAGYCTPSLTQREWEQATSHTVDYVLAVIEHFNPSGSNTIYWIPDPARRCVGNPRTSIIYAIPRASWNRATIPRL
jgi:Protein NO VEIN, C-terminal